MRENIEDNPYILLGIPNGADISLANAALAKKSMQYRKEGRESEISKLTSAVADIAKTEEKSENKGTDFYLIPSSSEVLYPDINNVPSEALEDLYKPEGATDRLDSLFKEYVFVDYREEISFERRTRPNANLSPKSEIDAKPSGAAIPDEPVPMVSGKQAELDSGLGVFASAASRMASDEQNNYSKTPPHQLEKKVPHESEQTANDSASGNATKPPKVVIFAVIFLAAVAVISYSAAYLLAGENPTIPKSSGLSTQEKIEAYAQDPGLVHIDNLIPGDCLTLYTSDEAYKYGYVYRPVSCGASHNTEIIYRSALPAQSNESDHNQISEQCTTAVKTYVGDFQKTLLPLESQSAFTVEYRYISDLNPDGRGFICYAEIPSDWGGNGSVAGLATNTSASTSSSQTQDSSKQQESPSLISQADIEFIELLESIDAAALSNIVEQREWAYEFCGLLANGVPIQRLAELSYEADKLSAAIAGTWAYCEEYAELWDLIAAEDSEETNALANSTGNQTVPNNDLEPIDAPGISIEPREEDTTLNLVDSEGNPLINGRLPAGTPRNPYVTPRD